MLKLLQTFRVSYLFQFFNGILQNFKKLKKKLYLENSQLHILVGFDQLWSIY